LTLLSLGKDYLKQLDKERIYAFFKKVKKGGKFMMHEYGECDLRGSYIVAIITKFLGINEDILEGVAENILASQTPEGGISNVIGG
jgi:prenyltransferase beta subunit